MKFHVYRGLRIFAQTTSAQTTFAAWQTPKRLLPNRLLPKTQESGNWQGSWHPDHMCCMLQSAFQDFTFTVRICSIRIKISPVLNAYVVMTSSLLHKDTENLKKNKRFPTTEPFSDYPYRAYCMYGNENFGKFTRFPFMIQNFHQASLVFQFWSDMGCDFGQFIIMGEGSIT